MQAMFVGAKTPKQLEEFQKKQQASALSNSSIKQLVKAAAKKKPAAPKKCGSCSQRLDLHNDQACVLAQTSQSRVTAAHSC